MRPTSASASVVLRRPQREHDELVAADAGDGVRLSDDRLEAPCDRAEHLVARLVSADVVDALEPVEVDDEERERLLGAPRARERLLDPVVEQRTVRQPGQRVAQGKSLRGLASARRGAGSRRTPRPRASTRSRTRRPGGRAGRARAREPAETDDEGGDHRPTGTSGRNLTVEVFAHVSNFSRPDARSGRVLRSPRIVVANGLPFATLPGEPHPSFEGEDRAGSR